MAGYTFIARARTLFRRLFRPRCKEEHGGSQKIPLHVLDGVCCGVSPADMEAQAYLDRLAWQGKYERPRLLEGYRLEEEERARFDADMREARLKWERGKEPERRVYAALNCWPSPLYKDDDEEFGWSMERLEVIRKYNHQFI